MVLNQWLLYKPPQTESEVTSQIVNCALFLFQDFICGETVIHQLGWFMSSWPHVAAVLQPSEPCKERGSEQRASGVVLPLDFFSQEQACDLQVSCKGGILNSIGREAAEHHPLHHPFKHSFKPLETGGALFQINKLSGLKLTLDALEDILHNKSCGCKESLSVDSELVEMYFSLYVQGKQVILCSAALFSTTGSLILKKGFNNRYFKELISRACNGFIWCIFE